LIDKLRLLWMIPLGDEESQSTQEKNMKLMIAALALATLVVSPALAQDPQVRAPKARHAHAATAAGSYSQQGRTETRSAHSSNPANDVYDLNGAYVGSDPDYKVRMEMLRGEMH
jgi:BRCT domain type II-containing protein